MTEPASTGRRAERRPGESGGSGQSRSALILAGGRSTRFGDADKAVATVDGTPMVRRVAERVGGVTDELVVNCRATQREAVVDALDGLAHRVAVDPVPDGGPVAGMRAGLRVASGDSVGVVGCDMPLADPALFDRLFETGGDVAVPRADDRLQPLHAVYDPDRARAACDGTIATGSRRLADVLARLDPVVVDVDADEPFTNVNTRADLAALTDR